MEADEDKLTREVGLKMDEYRHITVAKERLPSGKLGGISPEAVIKLSRLASVDYIIVEADGAARKSLKAPNSTEPVIPANTTLVVAVVGIEAVGRELTGENVFRPEIVSQLTGLSPGDFVTGDAVAVLITHPLGLTRGSPSEARIIPFINKMDLDPGFVRGRELAEAVISRGHPRIERVILGRLQSSSPVVEIISK
ncbi:MAG: selenium cofactor biosynthesis protein YqeC [Dehalococcoidia bacterium]|nr:selenium cofactor biosynthesis protein YqeC [Dehalococcoidia bacterium]